MIDLDLELLPRGGLLNVLCLRPIHHVLEYEALFRLTAELRARAPAMDLHLYLRSALADGSPFALLPAHRVARLAERSGPGELAADLRRLARAWQPGASALVLAPPAGWGRVAVDPDTAPSVRAAPFGFRTAGCGVAAGCAAASERFLAALLRETPLWRVAEGARPPLSRHVEGHRFLLHQARFHIGDTLWLTPLLRALHAHFRRPQITVVGPPVAATVL